MSVAVLVGVLASLVSLFATVPQVLRAARTRSAEGVSWDSLVLSLATFTLWLVYAFAVADSIQIINNTIAFVLLVALAVVVFRAGVARTYWSAVIAVFASAAASFWLLDVANSFTLAMVATTISSVRMVPQTRLALSRAPLGGLCPWATVLAWIGMLLWFAYGLLIGDLAVALCSFLCMTMQTAIMARRLPPRRTLASLADGRLGQPVALLAAPVAARFPAQRSYDLAA